LGKIEWGKLNLGKSTNNPFNLAIRNSSNGKIISNEMKEESYCSILLSGSRLMISFEFYFARLSIFLIFHVCFSISFLFSIHCRRKIGCEKCCTVLSLENWNDDSIIIIWVLMANLIVCSRFLLLFLHVCFIFLMWLQSFF
jgi:hypothetical protein